MNKNGYTLIELLIAISVMTILFTGGIAGYREFSRRQTLTSVARGLKGELRTIQELATTGQKPAGVTCTRLIGYSFDKITSYRYELIANCSNGTFTIKSVDLPAGISLSVTSDPMLFKVLGLGTDQFNTNTITLTYTSTGNTETISVGKGGYIQ